ncbi:DNA-directed RNA polymerase subunit omega [Alteribacillus iranensis]|uniref:DNA-directed RNA polymerase subunit omega n=1 Tax=Alteribacillus iranensis TaxID=930128 RepID=A0A1I2A8W5_9BACI|nr:DNA-directed RNA polymerase subunit omega [Alteribacillus iranensis]SFE40187.1 DNA-directed RNA polymerase subunit omega [Alteribacillus iranensis]
MLYPSIDNLLKHIDSKYTLVTISARRARELKELEMEGAGDQHDSSKLVGIALNEINDKKLTYKKDS